MVLNFHRWTQHQKITDPYFLIWIISLCGTVSLTGDRAQGDDSKHWAYSSRLGCHINTAQGVIKSQSTLLFSYVIANNIYQASVTWDRSKMFLLSCSMQLPQYCYIIIILLHGGKLIVDSFLTTELAKFYYCLFTLELKACNDKCKSPGSWNRYQLYNRYVCTSRSPSSRNSRTENSNGKTS